MMAASPQHQCNRADFDALFSEISNWGRWGPEDEAGTLNHLTQESVARAAAVVGVGRTVSLAHDLDPHPGPDNTKPTLHYMSQMGDIHTTEPRANMDFIGIDFHGKSVTHLDALCHCNYMGLLYNGVNSAATVSSLGGAFGSVMTSASGVVGRGVLLDIPRHRGVNWMEPGTGVGAAELERVVIDAGTTLQPGDIVLIRTGHRHRRLGPRHGDAGKPRLHRLHRHGILPHPADGPVTRADPQDAGALIKT